MVTQNQMMVVHQLVKNRKIITHVKKTKEIYRNVNQDVMTMKNMVNKVKMMNIVLQLVWDVPIVKLIQDFNVLRKIIPEGTNVKLYVVMELEKVKN